MSIAKIGPEKYLFQDYVCIDMALRFMAEDGACFYVEPEGGEDCKLAFKKHSSPWKEIEIQVKGSMEPVTLNTVSECLLHFPALASSEMLVERLLNDDKHFVVLYMSGRSDDQSSVYLKDGSWSGEIHSEKSVKARDVDRLIQAMERVQETSKTDTPLGKARYAHSNRFLSSVDKKAMKAALRRLIIIERVSHESLDYQCKKALVENFYVPFDSTLSLVRDLLDEVRLGKNSQKDIIPNVKQIIERYSWRFNVPVDYLQRGFESLWCQQIEQDYVLLLSGLPRTGKTYAGRKIAGEMIQKGFTVNELDEIEKAERVLLQPGKSQELVLLDDPLGGVAEKIDAQKVIQQLSQLIPKLSAGRRLIVTQAEDRLLDAAGEEDLADVLTGDKQWIRIDSGPKDFLMRVWDSEANSYQLNKEHYEFVKIGIDNGVIDLEPGRLKHLAMNISSLVDDLTLEKVHEIAHQSAKNFGNSLINESDEKLLNSIAIGSSPHDPVTFRELAYMLGEGGDPLPSLSSHISVISLGNFKQIETKDLEYKCNPLLSSEYQKVLEKLELRKVIEISGKPADIVVTHPFYRTALETTVHDKTFGSRERLVSITKRGLFCAQSTTTRSVAKNLSWIFSVCAKKSETKQSLIALAIEGLDSRFPNTRDYCFGFLVRQERFLLNSGKQSLVELSRKVTGFNIETVSWHRGAARIEDEQPFNIKSLIPPDEADVANTIAQLNSETKLVADNELIADSLFYFRAYPEKLSHQAMFHILSNDESVIRSEGIFIWLSVDRHFDEEILRRILSEVHPAISVSVLRGLVASWSHLEVERRNSILSGLKSMISSSVNASAVVDELVNFPKICIDEKRSSWDIFSTLMLIVIHQIPSGHFINDARLYNAMLESISYTQPSLCEDLAFGWYKRFIKECVDRGDIPSDYEFGLLDYIFSVDNFDSSKRLQLVQDHLNLPGTGVKIKTISELVQSWKKLNEVEKELVLNALNSLSLDQKWLHAAALVQDSIPEEIAKTVFGTHLPDFGDPLELIDSMDEKLLSRILHVYCGSPQPLWYLGTHHRGKKVWQPVLEILASKGGQESFKLIWDDFLSFSSDAVMENILRKMNDRDLRKAFEIFIGYFVEHNSEFRPLCWKVFFDRAQKGKFLNQWLNEWFKYSPKIVESVRQLRFFIDLKILNDNVDSFRTEYFYVVIVPEMLKNVDIILQEKLNLISLMVNQQPPLFLDTCDNLKEIFSSHDPGNSKIIKLLKDRRVDIINGNTVPSTKSWSMDYQFSDWL